MVSLFKNEGATIAWTDGSCVGNDAGGAAIIMRPGLRNLKILAGTEGCTAQAGEAAALKACTEWLLKFQKDKKNEIFTDSYSTILALSSQTFRSKDVFDIYQNLRQLTATTVHHTPSHVGVLGNEEADKAAAEQVEKRKKEPKVRKKFVMDHQHKREKINEIILPENDEIMFFKKFENSAQDIKNLTRLYTEAGALKEYLCSIGQSVTQKCDYCRCRESFEHYMYKCPRFASYRHRLIVDKSWETKADYLRATGNRL